MIQTTPIIVLCFLLVSTTIFAQGGRVNKLKSKDTSEISIKRPFVDLIYGESQISRNGMTGGISDVTIYGISIGLKKEKEHKESKDIIVQDKTGLHFSLGRSPETGKSDSTYWSIPVGPSNTMEFWSLGSINGSAYGYKFGDDGIYTKAGKVRDLNEFDRGFLKVAKIFQSKGMTWLKKNDPMHVSIYE